MASQKSFISTKANTFGHRVSRALLLDSVVSSALEDIFKIDEVVPVKGQLEPISGTTDIKTPVGGKFQGFTFQMETLLERDNYYLPTTQQKLHLIK